MRYLDVEDLIDVAREVIGAGLAVRDFGLLDSAAHRPRASMFGEEAYPSLHLKAAALAESIARNHALVDGNKRLAYAAVKVFYGLNGHHVAPEDRDEAVDLFVAIATGTVSLETVARHLERWARPSHLNE